MKQRLYIYTEKNEAGNSDKKWKGWRGKTIMAFSPHADDLSVAAGGFLHLLSRDNKVVPVLGFTGWRGVNNGLGKKAAMATREKEMKKEARVLGFELPIFLRLLSYEGNTMINRRKDKTVISELLMKGQPDVIFLPSKRDCQPRHAVLTKYVLGALNKSAKTTWLVYYETPWSLFAPEQVNLIVPLRKQAVKQKINGIKAHASQIARTDFVRISRAMLEYRALTVPEQIIGGFGSQLSLGRWAEVYQMDKYKK